jgi:glycerophosphoryl diester phosphodiesterase
MTVTDRSPRAAVPVGEVGISAHRGASHEFPENTLAAFRRAIELGAEGIELDVALSSDGVAVIMHDISVDRTTDGTGDVAELTFEQLRGMDAGGEPVPTLDEVLALAAGHAEVNIELKAGDAAPAVAEAVARHPELRWFASGGQWDALVELTRLSPGARIYPLTSGLGDWARLTDFAADLGYPTELIRRDMSRFSHLGRPLDEAIAFALEVGADGLSIWEEGLTAEAVARVHEAGLAAWAWTVNEAGRAEEILRMGVDAICTDEPALLLRHRAQIAG